MSDSEKSTNWQKLAEELGAVPSRASAPPEPAAEDKPEPEGPKADSSASAAKPEPTAPKPEPSRAASRFAPPPRRRSTPSPSSQKSSDWSGLAGDLGVESTKEPQAVSGEAETTAKADQPESPAEQDLATSESSTPEIDTTTAESSSGEAVEVASSDGEESEEPRKPRGRRRRSRRGRGGKGKEERKAAVSDETEEAPQAEKKQEDSDSDSPTEKTGSGRRRRRRPRRKSAASRKETSETADEKSEILASDDAIEDDDDIKLLPSLVDAEHDEDNEDHPKRSPGKRSHRSIPTWAEAIELILATNKENRAKEPQRGEQRGRRRGRRGGKSSSPKK